MLPGSDGVITVSQDSIGFMCCSLIVSDSVADPALRICLSRMSLPVRKAISEIVGYTPGEQPQDTDCTKLNTNENPYPPSPMVVEAIREAATGSLNVYPDALATGFRRAAADVFRLDPNCFLAANGSDENLTIIVRTACDAGQLIAYPYPSYVLYETLAEIQDCPVERIPVDASFAWSDEVAESIRRRARLVFVSNPNSPTGNRWTPDELARLVPEDGLLVLDEAYGDFPDQPHRGELLHDSRFVGRLVITRTLSKSYSLAGLRFGFSIAQPELTAEMRKSKDSYNCDTIAIAAATAAIQDQNWMLANRSKIVATRMRLAARLPDFGFNVYPSEANFVWTQHASGRHESIYRRLKEKRILVRYMKFPGAGPDGGMFDGIRITVGADDQIDRLLDELNFAVSGVS